MLAFHHLTTSDKQYWTHASLILTIIYAVFAIANYVVQLATIIPSKISGVSESIQIMEQTSHFLFWDYDAVGYLSTYSNKLLFIGFPWAITAPLFMLMLAIMLRKKITTQIEVSGLLPPVIV